MNANDSYFYTYVTRFLPWFTRFDVFNSTVFPACAVDLSGPSSSISRREWNSDPLDVPMSDNEQDGEYSEDDEVDGEYSEDDEEYARYNQISSHRVSK